MELTKEQCESYQENGYLFVKNYIDLSTIDNINKEYNSLKKLDLPSRVMERDSDLVRGLHGCHLENDFFNQFIRNPCFLNPAEKLLEDKVYLYQFKINCKEAFGGDVWQWHQDFFYWEKEDGMQTPRALSIAIFLDDVTEFNGPLIIIPQSHKKGPQSHKKGMVDVPAGNSKDKSGDWKETVSSNLKYSLGKDTIKSMTHTVEMVAPKGSRGGALFFHPNIMHSSVPNISPLNRRLLILSYNSVSNALDPSKLWRPEFLVSRDTRPL